MLRYVADNFSKSALLVGIGPLHKQVVIVWRAVNDITNELGVAIEDFLSIKYYGFENLTTIVSCLLFYVVVPTE